MENEASKFFQKFASDLPKMSKVARTEVSAFTIMFNKIMKDGALTLKEKELIALGMCLVLRCQPCINLHIKKCVDSGATKEQILEVAGVGIMMQGGPGFTYIPKVIDALEALGK